MKPVLSPCSSTDVIADLQYQIQMRERGEAVHSNRIFTTGCETLDNLLPNQGIRQGSLVEWLGVGNASGAGTVSLIAGRQVCSQGRPLVLIDTRSVFFPWCLPLLGFDFSEVLLIRPTSQRDALWACEQALRCQSVGLVWANVERINSTSFRRLQLAAESTSGVGFLVRPAKAQSQPSWADVRLKVEPHPSFASAPCYRVRMVSCRGKSSVGTAEIQINRINGTLHEKTGSKNSLPLVSPMAVAASHHHASRV